MMDFGLEEYGKNRYIAKIKKNNESSLKLFKKLGFKDLKYVEAFEEYNLVKDHQEIGMGEVEKCKMGI